MPLGELEGFYPHNELHVDLILLLKEFCKTQELYVSRLHFRKVLSLLESHNKISASTRESLQETFDLRANKHSFYEAVRKVKTLAMELQLDFASRLGARNSSGEV